MARNGTVAELEGFVKEIFFFDIFFSLQFCSLHHRQFVHGIAFAAVSVCQQQNRFPRSDRRPKPLEDRAL